MRQPGRPIIHDSALYRQIDSDLDVVRPASDVKVGMPRRDRAGVALEYGVDLGDLVLGARQADL
jgi:hypothetical protein